MGEDPSQAYPLNEATMLQFDYERVHGLTIVEALGLNRRVLNDQSVAFDEIIIRLETGSIILKVNDDSDELLVWLEDSPDDGLFVPIAELAALQGKTLGWSWVCRNYRGYLDVFCISINGVDPDFMFLGKASSIVVKRVTGIKATPNS